MSQDSDSNPEQEPLASKEFETKINGLLTEYTIDHFDIICTLPNGSVYLNCSDIDEDDALSQIESTYESVQIVTTDQQKLPFVNALFAIFKEASLKSLYVDIWLSTENICSRMKVSGGQEFDYTQYLAQDESALAGVSYSVVHHDAH